MTTESLTRVREARTGVVTIEGVEGQYRLVIFERPGKNGRPVVCRWEFTIHSGGEGAPPPSLETFAKR